VSVFDSSPQFFTVCAAVCVAAVLVLAMCMCGAGWLLWAACLTPLFLLGKNYATVGVSPFYVMDIVALFALLATVQSWGPRAFSDRRLRWFRAVAVGLAVMACQAVYRGIVAEYPDPLKGAILGLYPLLGWGAATWFLTRPAEEAIRWRWALYVPTVGVILAWVLNLSMISAASGLYLAIAGAFGVQMRYWRNSPLLLWTLFGAALLTAIASKRGPLLAIVAAIVATTIASRPSRLRAPRWPVISWSLATVGVFTVLGLSVTGLPLSGMPVIGGVTERMSHSHDLSSEAGANVELRLDMWQEALKVAQREPFLGAGAGRPIDVVHDGERLNSATAGPHNSFVGYIYYLGWPAGIAVVLLVLATLRRTWKARHHPVAASWFGATVGVCVTACTNVALETTFIGLPSWLVLACAFALVGVPRGEESAWRPKALPGNGGAWVRTKRPAAEAAAEQFA
jgi:O-antigen ligase